MAYRLCGTACFGPPGGSRAGRSVQFGLTFAPTVPHLVHTIRNPSDGTVRSPGRWSTFMIFSWWQLMHQISSDRTPLARMFAKSIGSIGCQTARPRKF